MARTTSTADLGQYRRPHPRYPAWASEPVRITSLKEEQAAALSSKSVEFGQEIRSFSLLVIQ